MSYNRRRSEALSDRLLEPQDSGPNRLKKETPNIHWRTAAFAGIAAGAVATVFQIALWWITAEPLTAILFRDSRLTAAIVMGRQVLPPPATFDSTIMLVAAIVHLALSIAYGLALAAMISRLSALLSWPRSLLVGAAFGIALYAVNMYGFTIAFPWFAMARGWITAVTHAVFGIAAAAVYKEWTLQTVRIP